MKVPAPDYDWDAERRSVLEVIGKPDLGGVWFNALIDEDLVFQPLSGDTISGPAANEP
jgi:hypothetical protein